MKTPDGDKAIVLETEAKSAYRAVAARLSYVPSSMPKLLLATKKCEKASTCSSQADLTHLKKNGRPLMKESQCVWSFPWQDEIYVTEDFADAGRLREDGALYVRWRIATWRTRAVCVVIEPEGCCLKLV